MKLVFAKASRVSLVLALAAGCGGKDECTSIACAQDQATGQSQGGGGAGGQAGSSSFVGSGAETSSGSGGSGLGSGEACREITIEATATPVNIHVMLDRSTSMLDPANPADPSLGTRWDAITSALRAFINSDQANGASVGLQFFGLMATDDCQTAKYATPAVAVGPLPSVRAQLLASIDGQRPGSLTPTKPAVEGALQYALSVAQLPENADRATVVLLATDGLPSECGVTNAQGQEIISFQAITDVLRQYSQPAKDAQGNPSQPPILTYIVGTNELEANAGALAQAGGGQTFLVGRNGGDVEAEFLDAMLSIVRKPLTCELDVPQTAPDNGESVDFDKVKVSFVGATSGIAREIPRARGVGDCSLAAQGAWYYDDPAAPKKMFFCTQACSNFGAGSVKVELGCSPTRLIQ